MVVVDAFRGSYLLNPGPLRPGRGYTIQASPEPVTFTLVGSLLTWSLSHIYPSDMHFLGTAHRHLELYQRLRRISSIRAQTRRQYLPYRHPWWSC